MRIRRTPTRFPESAHRRRLVASLAIGSLAAAGLVPAALATLASATGTTPSAATCTGTDTWTGGGGADSSWSTAANWSARFPPTSSSAVTIPASTSGTAYSIQVGGVAVACSLAIGSSGAPSNAQPDVNVSTVLQVSGAVDDMGILRVGHTGDVTAASVTVERLASLIGNGTVAADVVVDGQVQPTMQTQGTSPSVLTITGNYSQASTATFAAFINSTASGGNYGALYVSGTATLAGQLATGNLTPFTPNPGDQYPLITAGSVTGSFSSLGLDFYPQTPGTTPAYCFLPRYGATTVDDLVSVSSGGTCPTSGSGTGGSGGGTPPPPVQSASIWPTSNAVNPGQSIGAGWSGLTIPPGVPVWISLHRHADTTNSYPLAYNTITTSSGFSYFTAPKTPGSYDFRLFVNGVEVGLPSSAFQVTSPAVSSTPALVNPGTPITASWTGLATTGNDWISLFASGAPDSSVLALKTVTTSSGSATFTAPTAPGTYEFRLFSNTFKVTTGGTFTVAGVVVIASASTIQAGGPVSATWNGLVPTGNDWIDLHQVYPPTPDTSFVTFNRISGPQGSSSFTAPKTVGNQYVFRLYRNGTEVAPSPQMAPEATFTVTARHTGFTAVVRPEQPTAAADGYSQAAVDVVLRQDGSPAGGTVVKLLSSSGSARIVGDPAFVQNGQVVTDGSGTARFLVTDSTQGQVTFNVAAPGNKLAAVQKASVTFGCDEANESTVEQDGYQVPADGQSTVRVTVTLNCVGNPSTGWHVPLAGHIVMLDPVFDPTAQNNALVIPDLADATSSDGQIVTDSNGQATFLVSDTSVETLAFTARDHSVADANGYALQVAEDAAVAFSTVPYGAAYVALGDSYSAGVGTGPDAYGSENNHCHRSANAYGPLLDQDLSLGDMAFLACSGAVTDDLFGPNHEADVQGGETPEPPQLCGAPDASPCAAGYPALGPLTRVVTLTIGGNDAGFVDVLKQCVQGRIPKITWPNGQPIIIGDGKCLADHALSAAVNARIDALGGKRSAATPGGRPVHSITDVLGEIHAAAPNAHVYVGLYPALFASHPVGNCMVGELYVHNVPVIHDTSIDGIVSSTNQAAINKLGEKLDRTIAAAVAGMGSWASVADTTSLFSGHNYCNGRAWDTRSGPWFNELFSDVDLNTKQSTYAQPGSFHPNTYGQNLGFEQAFVNAGV
ncbi:MAG TPA: SGNH/GDSL hydrolase family protein [Acidimicrobiales bacterium]|nr:SGNH/GDSL hydrolase family protein [Acidimicrobiales bacterium]